jgi:hypothetical protein
MDSLRRCRFFWLFVALLAYVSKANTTVQMRQQLTGFLIKYLRWMVYL